MKEKALIGHTTRWMRTVRTSTAAFIVVLSLASAHKSQVFKIVRPKRVLANMATTSRVEEIFSRSKEKLK